ncbi:MULTISPECIES: relaxase/mobilization nuclease domain-containing protein [unclassified Butyrivibrio]|uniref:relaxase/mobilization nuclease domain-containing protein n=1 Tax=unclassified Butyrivibrio TaxID=2639466 RepID=UPI0004011701|nr:MULTISPECIES: relaxase/mobilization nuclease domain-containing protein [unclassified Butyrivibrio]SFD07201.1 Relaxase/Mobilisation nuclease domain-containing protein [Butyrivibrio sp. YAB3001]
MAVIKAVSSHAPIGTAIDYVEKREKTEERLLYGIGVTPETAKEEMQATKEIYGKTDGRTYKHFVQSFAPGENITPEKAHEIAKEFAESCPLFKGYEVLIATHKDKKHVHTHFIINSVSFEDGKKFQMSSKDLQKMKDRSDEICHEHGLSICEKNKTFDGHERTGITAWTKEKYHFMKDMLEGKSVKSYVYNTMEVVKDSMNRAVSQKEFITILSGKGYSVDWQDKHKHLTFMDKDGNKVRDTNLNKTFNLGIGKEELLSRFERNAASMERDKYSHDKCQGIAARIRITEYMDVKADMDKEIKVRDKLIKKMHPFLKEGENAINSAKKALKKYEKELKECPKILFIKYHDLEEKIAHKEAYIEGNKKSITGYLKKNGFETLEKYNEYVAETSKMAKASNDLDKKIRSEQTSFDVVYARLDAEKDISQIVLDPRDVADLKENLKFEFGKDFSDADIEKADKQFCDYDNADPSTRRKMRKYERDIEKRDERERENGEIIEHSYYHEHDEYER